MNEYEFNKACDTLRDAQLRAFLREPDVCPRCKGEGKIIEVCNTEEQLIEETIPCPECKGGE